MGQLGWDEDSMSGVRPAWQEVSDSIETMTPNRLSSTDTGLTQGSEAGRPESLS